MLAGTIEVDAAVESVAMDVEDSKGMQKLAFELERELELAESFASEQGSEGEPSSYRVIRHVNASAS